MAMTGGVPVWVALPVLVLLLAALVVWAMQREAALQVSEARARQAEARAATAEAVVTTEAEHQAATATALAYASGPEAAVDRSLSLVLTAERDPTDEHLRAVNDAFGPAALGVMRPEIEHLLSGGLHLGGASGYDVTVLATAYPSPDQAQVHTLERWTYDERNAADQRSRCLVESSDQTYMLERAGPEWRVADIQLTTSTRVDCASP
jgi:heme exporter protein D